MSPTIGDANIETSVLIQPPGMIAFQPRWATAAPAKAADEGVGGAGGEAEVPGDEVPDDGADQGCDDDVFRGSLGRDKALPDGVGDLEVEDERGRRS